MQTFEIVPRGPFSLEAAKTFAGRFAARTWRGDKLGDRIDLDGVPHTAFPRPQRLLELREAPGLNEVKVERLHGLAEAALDGRLDTERLRSLPIDRAMEELMSLKGVGGFTA